MTEQVACWLLSCSPQTARMDAGKLHSAVPCQAAAQRVAAAEEALDGALGLALADDWDDAGSDAEAGGVEPEPPSFSRVDLSLPDALLRKRFPGFPVRLGPWLPCRLCAVPSLPLGVACFETDVSKDWFAGQGSSHCSGPRSWPNAVSACWVSFIKDLHPVTLCGTHSLQIRLMTVTDSKPQR